ncbi:TonB-dependent receptor [Taibaiella lutea]|uniref:TonB-dependent receptor n=1 Tax=Taibaiella lutea TaxID=2608001 RepID=A0A5M6CQC5_9BACT|nr:TonB-dependent receptor [Taibaiella lutea]KAA5537173.1 TonB-dependent receptor [Taibaiella lutea]
MKYIFTALLFCSVFGIKQAHAQIPIKTDDDPEYDNPVMGEDDSLYSNGPADTSSDLKYYIQPLNEITIQENRLQIPFAKQNRNITILDQSIIRTLPVKSVNELLTYVAGVDVRQRGPWGTQADIGIDGGTFDETLVLIDGIKISDPQTGHNMMNIPVPLSAVDRIEVLRGPAARIYGVNALNGAINIITKKPTQTGIMANVYAGSSFNKDTSNGKLFGGYGAEVSASLAGDYTQHLLSFSRQQASGYRYNTAFNNDKVYYQNQTTLSKAVSLQLMGGFVYNSFGANAFYSAPGDKESKETVQTGLAGIGATIQATPYWTIKPRVSYRYNNDDYIYIRQKPAVYNNRHETNVIDAELNNTFNTDIGDFGLGLELRNDKINSNSLGKRNRDNYGFFGEYSFNKIERLLVNIGAYANYNSDFGWRVMPGIDAGYRIYSGLRVFANAGVGQRLPTYTDLYYKGPANIGNPNLLPEYSYNVEGGLKYNDKQLNASISYFNRRTEGFIDWVKDTITDPWTTVNYQKINTQGISFAVDYRWRSEDAKYAKVAIITGFSYSYLDVKSKGSQSLDGDAKLSNYALQNLRNQVCANANFEFFHTLNITLAGRYQQRVNYIDYFLLDAKVSYAIQRFNIYAEVNNLTDVQYIEAAAVPMPGRWVTLGLKWAWWK